MLALPGNEKAGGEEGDVYNRPGKIDELPPDCQAIFAELSESLEYLPGQVICRQGDEDGYLFLLERGSLSVISDNGQGNRHKLATITPGSFFGEINFIFGARRVASVIADEKSVVRRLSNSLKSEVIKKMPSLYNRLRDLGLNRWGAIRFLSNPLLEGMKREDQDAMLADAVSGTYVAGTVLFDHGDRIDDFIMLLSGTLYIVDENGVEKELTDGDWLLPGGIEGGASRWRAIAVIECMAIFVPLAAIREIGGRYEAFMRRLGAGCSV